MALGQYHSSMEKKPQDTPSRHADKYIVRLPEGMREQIAAAAEENKRSMNSEIVSRLAASFAGTFDETLLRSTAARLNLNLATAEFREHQSTTALHNLASFVHEAANALLKGLNPTDRAARGALVHLALRAEPYIKQRDLLEAEASEKIAKIREANALLQQAGKNLAARVGVTMPSPGEMSESPPQAADVHPNLVVGDNVELPGERTARKKSTK